jgi:hypothetical protein
MIRAFFRDDGYRGPKIVILLVVVVMMVSIVYIVRASRRPVSAGLHAEDNRSGHVRRIDQAVEDAHETMAGRTVRTNHRD